MSTYAPGGWQAPSDLYQCTFEDKSHAFTLTPRTMVGLMVSLSKNRYVESCTPAPGSYEPREPRLKELTGEDRRQVM